MKFESLQFSPSHGAGWASEELVFGRAVTQLYAPNGSGKTPLIQSIMFCLGLEVQFREDVVRNTSKVTLKTLIKGQILSFSRRLDGKFDLTVSNAEKTINRFYNEEDFSRFMLKVLGLRDDRLTTNGNTSTIPYFSAILPLFYLDQDTGYSDYYVPARQSFIKGQYAEMIRLAVGLPARSSFDSAKKSIALKQELEYLDKTINDSRKLIDRLRQDLSPTKKNETDTDREISALKSRLDELKSTKDIRSETINSFDHLITEMRRQHRDMTTQQLALEAKIKSSAQIRQEIESEIETLDLNEEARRAFMSFSEICTTPSCGMFLVSADSYGKSLLYLRDQIKDLDTVSTANIQQAEAIATHKSWVERQISELSEKRGLAEREAGIEMFIEAISKIASEIFELELEKTKFKKYQAQEQSHFELQNRRNKTLTEQESLGPQREQSLEVVRFKRNLAEKMADWLNTLNSKNISRDIRIDSDLKPVLGTEKIGIIKGSSKARTVLAFHAALFEICTSDPSSPFRTLIFDTPRQQEIHSEDLDAYFKRLKLIATQNDAQIVFSTTSYRFEIDPNLDAEWLPRFGGFEQPMYLGDFQNLMD
ncbi:hypothetical protein RIN61_23440 [Pseudomonas inefficax]|uniref:hypothetical protein n=1 Tax=Pseudomonas inefficax TaxID=2078786 RepID=UPI0028BE43AD|nr:hypothetical protein [Pseudomonas inefficax]WNN39113.1 hypothetical protein RIN61_23440 [Pseudomonas inefficax]